MPPERTFYNADLQGRRRQVSDLATQQEHKGEQERPSGSWAIAYGGLFTGPSISQRGNGSLRSAAMLNIQHSQGNRAVLRAIQRQSDEEARRRRQPPAPPHTLNEPALPPLLNWDGSIHQPPAHTPGGGALPPVDRDWGGPGRQGGPGAPDLSDLPPLERNWDGPSSLGPAVSPTAAPLPPIDRVWDEPLPPIDSAW